MFKDTTTQTSLTWPDLRPSLSFPGSWITLFLVTETSVYIEQDVFTEGQDELWKQGKEKVGEGVLVPLTD